MPFNSIIFVGFLAGVTALYYLVPRLAKPYFLLVASYAFYLYQPENARLVALLISATLVTWAAGLALGRTKKLWVRRAFLLLSLLVCLGILFFYKYFGFASGIAAAIAGWFGGTARPVSLDLVAPLGLSYFTFQSLGYVIDVYLHQTEPEKNPLKYALFVSFFPCIFTGPIERKGHLMPQFDAARPFDYSRTAGGAARVLWGYVKKMVIADNLAVFVAAVYKTADSCAGPYLVAASLLFSYQLYLDFSGCCDIAIGGARMLGIDLLENFNRPFAACTYTELWNRWHISLTSWFRDYLYIPLGGNRKGALRQNLNQLLVFLVSGLWHGASLSMAVWGLLNGAYLCIGKATQNARTRLARRNPLYRFRPVKRVIQCVIVYLLFTSCIVFFRASEIFPGSEGLADALYLYGHLFTGWDKLFAASASVWRVFASIGLDVQTLAVLGFGVALVETLESVREPVSRVIRKVPIVLRWPLYYVLCLAMLFFGSFANSGSIYGRF